MKENKRRMEYLCVLPRKLQGLCACGGCILDAVSDSQRHTIREDLGFTGEKTKTVACLFTEPTLLRARIELGNVRDVHDPSSCFGQSGPIKCYGRDKMGHL